MKEQLARIVEKDKQFNAGDMAAEVFGFRRDVHYDLLVVSDNSANGEPLLGMDEQQHERYDTGRKILIPRLLQKIAEMA